MKTLLKILTLLSIFINFAFTSDILIYNKYIPFDSISKNGNDWFIKQEINGFSIYKLIKVRPDLKIASINPNFTLQENSFHYIFSNNEYSFIFVVNQVEDERCFRFSNGEFYIDPYCSNSIPTYSVFLYTFKKQFCKQGFDFSTEQCITCPEGQEFNRVTGQCEPPCLPGLIRNPKTGVCECPPNQEFDSNTHTCVDLPCKDIKNLNDRMQCFCEKQGFGDYVSSKQVGLPGYNPFDKIHVYTGLAIDPTRDPLNNSFCKVQCTNGKIKIFDGTSLSPGFCSKDNTIHDNYDSFGGVGGETSEDDGEWIDIDLNDIPTDNTPSYDLDQELSNLKKEIEIQKEVEIEQKVDDQTTIIKNKGEVNPNDYTKKDESGQTQDKISNPKPGVTVIDHADGTTSIIFEGSKLPTSLPNQNNQNNQNNTTIQAKDYTENLNNIIKLLQQIEKNTDDLNKGSFASNTDGNGTGIGQDGNGTGEGKGLGDNNFGLDDGGLYDENMAGLNNLMSKFDEISSIIDDLTSFFEGKGIPSLQASNIPNSCPISRTFATDKINKEIEWDLCKVFSPIREPIYVLSYILFLGIGFALVSRMLFVLFIGV